MAVPAADVMPTYRSLSAWALSESPTIRPEGALSEVYTPEATREELAAAVGQVLDILSDDEEEDE